tara:strand:- start:516 stop:1475 length:960 start_codon:yes stop_codon:yes gene_type:complete
MKILITGIAGFIAFNFAKEISKNRNVKIVGIDNLSDYYSVRLKKKRIQLLNKNKNFKFLKIDLLEKDKIIKIFKTFKFDEVYNFAAQAGVRFSMENPSAYIDTNVSGFSNLISVAKNFKTKKFFYASSSSVYGDNNRFPLHEKEEINPKNIYGLSKKFNEEIAQNFFEMYNFKSTGLRFFTVFGEWGRPDMFMLKLLNAAYKKRKFYLNNKGNHYRDFTYIKDVISLVIKLRKVKNNKHEVYNICSNKPIGLKKVMNFIGKFTPKTKIILREKQLADIYKTHGSNTKIIKKIGNFNFTNLEVSIKNTINWYKNNSHLFD